MFNSSNVSKLGFEINLGLIAENISYENACIVCHVTVHVTFSCDVVVVVLNIECQHCSFIEVVDLKDIIAKMNTLALLMFASCLIIDVNAFGKVVVILIVVFLGD